MPENPVTPPDTFLGTREVMRRLSISDGQLRLLLNEGAFPGAFKGIRTDSIDGEWRIPESGLAEYIRRRQAATAAPTSSEA